MTDPAGDPRATMVAWREAGAERFDPVGFRFIEALARRAEAHGGEARRLLEGKLAKAVAEYGERFRLARGEAGTLLRRLAKRYPAAADDLQRRYEAGDFKALGRAAAELEGGSGRGPLAELLSHAAPHATEKPASAAASSGPPGAAPAAELKSVRYFRETWSKLSVDQQLAQALAQAPENAGPLNSQLLVLQSLKLMRDVSPDYLNRFMSYVDALLWLEQANGAGTAKSAPRSDGERKRKSGRAPLLSSGR